MLHPSRFTGLGALVLFVATGASASGPVRADAPCSPDSESIAVRCGTLIDGVSSQPRTGITVVIEHGRVTEVASGAAAPSEIAELDLSGYTCLPGLIDMHTHLTDRPGDTADLSVYYTRTPEQEAPIARENARATLLAGFTTARDVGTYIAWTDPTLRDEINAGQAVGPRMQVPGFYLTIPGGGGDLVIPGHAESEIPARIRMGVARGAEISGARRNRLSRAARTS